MKLFIVCGALLALLNLSACASTADKSDTQGQNQFYGQIKGGIESSHTTH